MSALYTVLRIGREVTIHKDIRRFQGFSRGRIVGLISTVERAAADGGYYRIERLDGPEDNKDLVAELHRSVFTPVPIKRFGRRVSTAKVAAPI